MKDTFIAYIRPSDGVVADVVLMDRDFSIKIGRKDTGINNGLLISNLTRCVLAMHSGLASATQLRCNNKLRVTCYFLSCVCVCVRACIQAYERLSTSVTQ